MVDKAAQGPKVSLADLIDERLQVEDQILQLEARKKELAEKIAKKMHAAKIKSAMGNSGEGYRLATWLQCDFKDEVLEYIRRIKKVGLFIGEPLVTKARLRDAFAGGFLTAAQHDKIKSFAGKDYPVNRLYRIDKEGKEQK